MVSKASGTKIPWVKVIIAGLVGLVAAALLLRGGNLSFAIGWAKDLFARFMALIRDAGPVAFFLAMALLPAVGAPMLAFTLVAGSAFGEQLGMGWVVTLSLVATVVNFVVTYALARRALRPLLTWLVGRLGYALPKVEAGDETSLAIILRVTPGIPFCVQNYLLGLAEIPFGKFFIWSAVLCLPQTVGFVIFGDALTEGKGKIVMYAIGLLAIAAGVTHMLRNRYSRKKVVT
jgi:uncharacterized membrane protein YdjX (TVP38/TMEM64 family)